MKINKKGLTPIIAVILLLMMTVAGAGAAFFWFVRIQSEMQGGTETYSQQLAEKISAKVGISTANFNESTDLLSIWFQNLGSRSVPVDNGSVNPTTTWILQDYDMNVVCSGNWNSAPHCEEGCGNDIEIKEVQKVVLNLSGGDGSCSIDSYANESLFYMKIDFSGITATGGQFTK